MKKLAKVYAFSRYAIWEIEGEIKHLQSGDDFDQSSKKIMENTDEIEKMADNGIGVLNKLKKNLDKFQRNLKYWGDNYET